MGDTVITVVAIVLAAVLMFIFPLMSISERNDDISQLAVHTAVVEFVDNVRLTGKITQKNYSKLLQDVAATGNSYDVEVVAKILDENPGKKGQAVDNDKIGENIYYAVYTSQIEDEIGIGNSNPKTTVKLLKEGDIISASVKNTNTTIAQMLKNFFYSIAGNDTYSIEASHSGVVMTNGK